MELDQVETFLAVATFGGFHRAADALRISQPAVSARIRSLEQSLGIFLFARSRSGLTLSDAGKAFRPHAEQLLRTAALARQAVHQKQPGTATPLQIAASVSISVYFLPDVLKRFSNANPKLLINIRAGHSKQVLEMVLGDETEIGLARSLQHPEVETISLRDDPLLLVTKGGKGGKFTRRARLEDVANWPLISFERGSSDWTLTQSLFRRAGLVANIAYEVDSIEIAKRMVERGLGFAFLPQLAVATELRTGHMVGVKILDAEPLGRSLDLIHARRHPLRPEALAFLQAVREEAASGVSPFGPGSTRIRKRLGR